MHLEQVPGFKNMYSPSSILFCESKKNFLVVFSLVSGNDHYRCSKELFLKYYGAYPQNRSDPFHMFLLLLHTQKWVPATDRCSNGSAVLYAPVRYTYTYSNGRTSNLWAASSPNSCFRGNGANAAANINFQLHFLQFQSLWGENEKFKPAFLKRRLKCFSYFAASW